MIRTYLLDPLERAASTFVQQFVAILLASGSAVLAADQFSPGIVHNWLVAVGAAGSVAFFALLKGAAALGLPFTAGASFLPPSIAAPAVADAGPADKG